MKFIVIGITDAPHPFFPPEVLHIIEQGTIFSGGLRHHEIVASMLPAGAEWIDITAPLDSVFERYAHALPHSTIIVFASGDPLFFGFANTIKRKMPEADIILYPTFNSLQMLAHRLLLPYHDMQIVSLTGRPWPAFDRALIQQCPKIGILTDKEHTPAAIAQRMLDYGYTSYTMHVGEHLGSPSQEKVTTLTLEEATDKTFSHPNCLILVASNHPRSTLHHPLSTIHHPLSTLHHPLSTIHHPLSTIHHPLFGLPDKDFTLLDGREKMITKMPIRLLTLQSLDLPKRQVFWDIGFCTGSVSIEARLLFPHLQVCSFEIRPECEAIIQENARRFGAPGIDVHIGDFLETEISQIPRPDAVFIGGHGGHLKEIMEKVLTVLADDGIIVFNSVTSPKVPVDSRKLWQEACTALGLQQDEPLRIQLNNYNPIEILRCRK